MIKKYESKYIVGISVQFVKNFFSRISSGIKNKVKKIIESYEKLKENVKNKFEKFKNKLRKIIQEKVKDFKDILDLIFPYSFSFLLFLLLRWVFANDSRLVLFVSRIVKRILNFTSKKRRRENKAYKERENLKERLKGICPWKWRTEISFVIHPTDEPLNVDYYNGIRLIEATEEKLNAYFASEKSTPIEEVFDIYTEGQLLALIKYLFIAQEFSDKKKTIANVLINKYLNKSNNSYDYRDNEAKVIEVFLIRGSGYKEYLPDSITDEKIFECIKSSDTYESKKFLLSNKEINFQRKVLTFFFDFPEIVEVFREDEINEFKNSYFAILEENLKKEYNTPESLVYLNSIIEKVSKKSDKMLDNDLSPELFLNSEIFQIIFIGARLGLLSFSERSKMDLLLIALEKDENTFNKYCGIESFRKFVGLIEKTKDSYTRSYKEQFIEKKNQLFCRDLEKSFGFKDINFENNKKNEPVPNLDNSQSLGENHGISNLGKNEWIFEGINNYSNLLMKDFAKWCFLQESRFNEQQFKKIIFLLLNNDCIEKRKRLNSLFTENFQNASPSKRDYIESHVYSFFKFNPGMFWDVLDIPFIKEMNISKSDIPNAVKDELLYLLEYELSKFIEKFKNNWPIRKAILEIFEKNIELAFKDFDEEKYVAFSNVKEFQRKIMHNSKTAKKYFIESINMYPDKLLDLLKMTSLNNANFSLEYEEIPDKIKVKVKEFIQRKSTSFFEIYESEILKKAMLDIFKENVSLFFEKIDKEKTDVLLEDALAKKFMTENFSVYLEYISDLITTEQWKDFSNEELQKIFSFILDILCTSFFKEKSENYKEFPKGVSDRLKVVLVDIILSSEKRMQIFKNESFLKKELLEVLKTKKSNGKVVLAKKLHNNFSFLFNELVLRCIELSSESNNFSANQAFHEISNFIENNKEILDEVIFLKRECMDFLFKLIIGNDYIHESYISTVKKFLNSNVVGCKSYIQSEFIDKQEEQLLKYFPKWVANSSMDSAEWINKYYHLHSKEINQALTSFEGENILTSRKRIDMPLNLSIDVCKGVLVHIFHENDTITEDSHLGAIQNFSNIPTISKLQVIKELYDVDSKDKKQMQKIINIYSNMFSHINFIEASKEVLREVAKNPKQFGNALIEILLLQSLKNKYHLEGLIENINQLSLDLREVFCKKMIAIFDEQYKESQAVDVKRNEILLSFINEIDIKDVNDNLKKEIWESFIKGHRFYSKSFNELDSFNYKIKNTCFFDSLDAVLDEEEMLDTLSFFINTKNQYIMKKSKLFNRLRRSSFVQKWIEVEIFLQSYNAYKEGLKTKALIDLLAKDGFYNRISSFWKEKIFSKVFDGKNLCATSIEDENYDLSKMPFLNDSKFLENMSPYNKLRYFKYLLQNKTEEKSVVLGRITYEFFRDFDVKSFSEWRGGGFFKEIEYSLSSALNLIAKMIEENFFKKSFISKWLSKSDLEDEVSQVGEFYKMLALLESTILKENLIRIAKDRVAYDEIYEETKKVFLNVLDGLLMFTFSVDDYLTRINIVSSCADKYIGHEKCLFEEKVIKNFVDFFFEKDRFLVGNQGGRIFDSILENKILRNNLEKFFDKIIRDLIYRVENNKLEEDEGAFNAIKRFIETEVFSVEFLKFVNSNNIENREFIRSIIKNGSLSKIILQNEKITSSISVELIREWFDIVCDVTKKSELSCAEALFSPGIISRLDNNEIVSLFEKASAIDYKLLSATDDIYNDILNVMLRVELHKNLSVDGLCRVFLNAVFLAREGLQIILGRLGFGQQEELSILFSDKAVALKAFIGCESFIELIPNSLKNVSINDLYENDFRSFSYLCKSKKFISDLDEGSQKTILGYLAERNDVEISHQLIEWGVGLPQDLWENANYTELIKSSLSFKYFNHNIVLPNSIMVSNYCSRFELLMNSTYKILQGNNNLNEDVVRNILEMCDTETLKSINMTSKSKSVFYTRESVEGILTLYNESAVRPQTFAEEDSLKLEELRRKVLSKKNPALHLSLKNLRKTHPLYFRQSEVNQAPTLSARLNIVESQMVSQAIDNVVNGCSIS